MVALGIPEKIVPLSGIVPVFRRADFPAMRRKCGIRAIIPIDYGDRNVIGLAIYAAFI